MFCLTFYIMMLPPRHAAHGWPVRARLPHGDQRHPSQHVQGSLDHRRLAGIPQRQVLLVRSAQRVYYLPPTTAAQYFTLFSADKEQWESSAGRNRSVPVAAVMEGEASIAGRTDTIKVELLNDQ